MQGDTPTAGRASHLRLVSLEGPAAQCCSSMAAARALTWYCELGMEWRGKAAATCKPSRCRTHTLAYRLALRVAGSHTWMQFLTACAVKVSALVAQGNICVSICALPFSTLGLHLLAAPAAHQACGVLVNNQHVGPAQQVPHQLLGWEVSRRSLPPSDCVWMSSRPGGVEHCAKGLFRGAPASGHHLVLAEEAHNLMQADTRPWHDALYALLQPLVRTGCTMHLWTVGFASIEPLGHPLSAVLLPASEAHRACRGALLLASMRREPCLPSCTWVTPSRWPLDRTK